MAVRRIVPQDVAEMGRIVQRVYHYPENPEWDIPTDFADYLQRAARIYRLLWPVGRFFKGYRDAIKGFVYETDNKIVGFVMLRGGKSGVWEGGMLGVLPEYRRQGIARQLLESRRQHVIDQGGRLLHSSVREGNLPALTLQKSLGANFYGKQYAFAVPTPAANGTTLPPPYQLGTATADNYQAMLERANTPPPKIKPYRDESKRGLVGLVDRFSGANWETFAMMKGEQLAAYALCILAAKTVSISIEGDIEDEPQAILNFLVSQAPKGYPIELSVADWQPGLWQAAHELWTPIARGRTVTYSIDLT